MATGGWESSVVPVCLPKTSKNRFNVWFSSAASVRISLWVPTAAKPAGTLTRTQQLFVIDPLPSIHYHLDGVGWHSKTAWRKQFWGCLQCWWHFFLLLPSVRSVKGCHESWTSLGQSFGHGMEWDPPVFRRVSSNAQWCLWLCRICSFQALLRLWSHTWVWAECQGRGMRVCWVCRVCQENRWFLLISDVNFS